MGHRREHRIGGHAGVVDDDVDLGLAEQLVDRRARRGGVADVELRDPGAAAELADLGGERVGGGALMDAGQRDVEAIPGEGPRDRRADSPARPGDQRDPPGHGHGSPSGSGAPSALPAPAADSAASSASTTDSWIVAHSASPRLTVPVNDAIWLPPNALLATIVS